MKTATHGGELLKNRALAGESRVRILEALRRERRALDAHELSARVDLHPSTVRFHLQALEDAGLVDRTVEREGRPGRPRVAYAALVPEDPVESAERYLLLSRILASSIAGRVADPGGLAREAGREWGRAIAREGGLAVPPSMEEAVRALMAMLEDLGFAPQIEADGPEPSVWLRRCPFRDVAETNPDVVCSVHLGLMQGALSGWRAALRAESLEPFVQPDLCRARFSERRRRARRTRSRGSR
jgi:predicted ArsR family transcriptional regulator